MPSSVDYQPLIQRLLDKSKEGKVAWEWPGGYGGYPTEFICSQGENDKPYTFTINQHDAAYTLSMTDSDGVEVFRVTGEEQVLWESEDQKRMYELLSELFELARRKALKVEQKVSYASEMLESL
jgi:hypothetical protein